MRRSFLILLLLVAPSTAHVGRVLLDPPVMSAQGVTIGALMASPFPTELVAAPTGARFAWVQSVEGVRNIWIADARDVKASVDFLNRKLRDRKGSGTQ